VLRNGFDRLDLRLPGSVAESSLCGCLADRPHHKIECAAGSSIQSRRIVNDTAPTPKRAQFRRNDAGCCRRCMRSGRDDTSRRPHGGRPPSALSTHSPLADPRPERIRSGRLGSDRYGLRRTSRNAQVSRYEVAQGDTARGDGVRVHTEEVTGSIPVSPTTGRPGQRLTTSPPTRPFVVGGAGEASERHHAPSTWAPGAVGPVPTVLAQRERCRSAVGTCACSIPRGRRSAPAWRSV
jgi:hypothetical protein